MKNLEIACFDEISAKKAVESVADRIELCDNLEAGGTTPNLNFFKSLKAESKIPIYVMIRPRGGNFIYSNEEIMQMKKSIIEFEKAGADGFVFGLLNSDNDIDEENCQQLIELSQGKPCSFHRAIDHTPNYFKNIEKVINLGFKTILTSGNTSSAEKGLETLKEAQQKFGDKISIMPGGGVRSSNLNLIAKTTECCWFHSSAIKEGTNVSKSEIKALKEVLNSL